MHGMAKSTGVAPLGSAIKIAFGVETENLILKQLELGVFEKFFRLFARVRRCQAIRAAAVLQAVGALFARFVGQCAATPSSETSCMPCVRI